MFVFICNFDIYPTHARYLTRTNEMKS